jgi:hypothetical protein
MDQLRNFADDRLVDGCIYCGGKEETRDHVPSRVFLDAPLPENLPVVLACASCNNGFSKDEQYLACLIESVIAGSTDPGHIRRPSVAAILRETPALRALIDQARILKDGHVHFNVELERVKNVLLKLARGHAAFELSQICREEPDSFWWCPLVAMTEDQKEAFDACHVTQLMGEIGSRSSQRALVTQVLLQSISAEQRSLGLLVNDWLDVQDGRYRYLAIGDLGKITIRIVIAEYLACEVTWAA